MVTLRSVQAERDQRPTLQPAEPIDVENYIAGAPDGVLECRARGRHRFPVIRSVNDLVFRGATPDGLLVRRVRCECCDMVDEVQHWEPYLDGVRRPGGGRRSVTRLRKVRRYLDYDSRGDFQYAAPAGIGRILSSQVVDAVASSAVETLGLTPNELLLKARQDGGYRA